MLALRIALGLALAYVVLVILAWRFQERLAFPAPRAPLPDPQRVGVANGERIQLVSSDGTSLVGWYLEALAREAAGHPVAGLILESPFTSAAAMARQLYALLPRFIVRLSLDNLGRMRQIRCPVLVFHGDADRLVPTATGKDVAAAAAGPVELVLIHGAGHNDTYDVGGRAYRDKVWAFVR